MPEVALVEWVAHGHLATEGPRGAAVEALTLGEAICRPMSVRCHLRSAGEGADLGGDQGRETALLDEAHLDGCLAAN
jgi:hypothetical protein